jgi:hypothetical protein
VSTDLSTKVELDASGKLVGDYQEGPPGRLNR